MRVFNKNIFLLDNKVEFYLSKVESGTYFVQLDKNIIEENNLQNIEDKRY